MPLLESISPSILFINFTASSIEAAGALLRNCKTAGSDRRKKTAGASFITILLSRSLSVLNSGKGAKFSCNIFET